MGVTRLCLCSRAEPAPPAQGEGGPRGARGWGQGTPRGRRRLPPAARGRQGAPGPRRPRPAPARRTGSLRAESRCPQTRVPGRCREFPFPAPPPAGTLRGGCLPAARPPPLAASRREEAGCGGRGGDGSLGSRESRVGPVPPPAPPSAPAARSPEPAGPAGAGGAPLLGAGPAPAALAAAAPPPPRQIALAASRKALSCLRSMPSLFLRPVTESPSVSLCLMPLPGPRWPRARAQGVPASAAQPAASAPPARRLLRPPRPPGSVLRPRPRRAPPAARASRFLGRCVCSRYQERRDTDFILRMGDD